MWYFKFSSTIRDGVNLNVSYNYVNNLTDECAASCVSVSMRHCTVRAEMRRKVKSCCKKTH